MVAMHTLLVGIFVSLTLLPSTIASVILTSVTPDCMTKLILSIGLEMEYVMKYTEIFRNERVDERVLQLLSVEQLESLGVSLLGHRVLIHNFLAEEASTVCENGGSCNLVSSDLYQCVCRDGFGGSNCSEVTDCTPTICMNHGNCTQENGSVLCHCQPGYSGARCEVGSCLSLPCLNGGTCVTTTDGYSCNCTNGFDGVNCEIELPTSLEKVKDKVDHLSFEVDVLQKAQLVLHKSLQNMISNARIEYQSAFSKIQGPRFFTEWTTVNYSGTTQTKLFLVESRELLFILNMTGLCIYQLSNEEFLPIQHIRVERASAFDVFTSNSEYYVVITSKVTNSRLYKWNFTSVNFYEIEELLTFGAEDVEFVSTRHWNFLVFSSHSDTLVYIWYNGHFVYYQSLHTTGAQEVLYVRTIHQHVFLFVVQILDSETTHSNGTIYRWNGTYFELDHFISTNSVSALCSFTVGFHTFLLTSHNDTMAFMYRYSETKHTFVFHTDIAISSSSSAQYFVVNSEHFVVVAGHNHSVLYKIDGVVLVPFQEFAISKSSSVSTFSLSNGCTVLAISNQGDGISLYKWTSASTNDVCYS